jgi:hypothetical protein
MCFIFVLLFAGPRAGIIFWWILEPGRWDSAFESIVWPILGFIFLPWTTLTFVGVAPFGNVNGGDWVWLALAAILDLLQLAATGYTNRDRLPDYRY